MPMGNLQYIRPGVNLIRWAMLSVVCLAALPLSAQKMAPWLTRSVDNARSGWNSHETQLTQASVTTKGIVRFTIIPVIGDARGMEAQPLVLPQVKLPKGSTHDVMVLPSMANVVRGVDARSGAGLWQVTLGQNLGMPINGNTPLGPKTQPDNCAGAQRTIDCHAINDKWGVLSTGVIDPDTQRLYLVAWISPDGTPQNAKHFVFVLNVKDGTEVVPPVEVKGTSGTQSYSDTMRKQRSALALATVGGKKTVFWASGTIMETGKGAAGWIFAFDCASNSITAALATTAGEGAGIWMAGGGPAGRQPGFPLRHYRQWRLRRADSIWRVFYQGQVHTAFEWNRCEPHGRGPLDALDGSGPLRPAENGGQGRWGERSQRGRQTCKQRHESWRARRRKGKDQYGWNPSHLSADGNRQLVR